MQTLPPNWPDLLRNLPPDWDEILKSLPPHWLATWRQLPADWTNRLCYEQWVQLLTWLPPDWPDVLCALPSDWRERLSDWEQLPSDWRERLAGSGTGVLPHIAELLSRLPDDFLEVVRQLPPGWHDMLRCVWCQHTQACHAAVAFHAVTVHRLAHVHLHQMHAHTLPSASPAHATDASACAQAQVRAHSPCTPHTCPAVTLSAVTSQVPGVAGRDAPAATRLAGHPAEAASRFRSHPRPAATQLGRPHPRVRLARPAARRYSWRYSWRYRWWYSWQYSRQYGRAPWLAVSGARWCSRNGRSATDRWHGRTRVAAGRCNRRIWWSWSHRASHWRYKVPDRELPE